MAWRCSGSSMSQLVHNMAANGIITNAKVEQVMKMTDRKNYVEFSSAQAYLDAPMSIGYNATISAPHMVFLLISMHTLWST